jgi:hypothetical protein
MALINCPECIRQVSDKATQCPNCAYPIATMAMQPAENLEAKAPNYANQIAIRSMQKSAETSFILTFLFGPLGLLYGNPKKAVTVILIVFFTCVFLTLILSQNPNEATLLTLLVSIIGWIYSIITGSEGVKQFNASLLTSNVDNHLQVKTNLNDLEKLRVKIIEEQQLYFYEPSKKEEIIALLKSICISEQETKLAITNYKLMCHTSLQNDIRNLSKEIAEQKKYLTIFDQYNLLSFE